MHNIDHHLISVRVALELLPTLGYEVHDDFEQYRHLDSEESNPALNLHQALSFYRTLIRRYPNPLLALQIAEVSPVQALGMFGFGLMCSSSLRASLEFLVRFRRLSYTLMAISFETGPVYSELSLIPANVHVDPQLAIFFADRDVASIVNSFRSTKLGAVPLERVNLVHDGFGLASEYEDHLECEIKFNSPAASLMFRSEHLDQPSPYRNAEAFRVCEWECERQLAEISADVDIVARVRQELLGRPGYLQDIESIADQMNLSTRTLRRRLADRAASFQQLQQEIRYQQARDYLRRPSLSVAAVSTLLGFTEPGNFSQAFKRWSDGLSPRQFRRTLRA